MHEMSICLALLKQIEDVAEKHKARCVEKIFVTIGPLSGVEPALLEGAFSIARQNTVASDAELVFETGEVRVICDECGAESQASVNQLLCGECKSWKTRVTSGYELTLKRVELSFPEEDTTAH